MSARGKEFIGLTEPQEKRPSSSFGSAYTGLAVSAIFDAQYDDR